MKKKLFSMLVLLAAVVTGAWAQGSDPDPIELTSTDGKTWTLASMPAYDVELEVEYYATTPFDLTVGESLHGTVQFTVGSEVATQACYDDVVTVTVTPDEGYSAKDVTVRAYTSWEAAARSFRAPSLVDDITVTKQTDGTWTFTMPEANVWVVVTYTKDLQDAWIQAIADQTYTGEALTPAITVKDGETTLTLNTDYTVAYADNTAAGTATVTVTGTGNYSGEASATFTIAKADITMTTAPAAVADLVYSGNPQTLITAGVASFGTVLYSTDGETYAEALPQGTTAGAYTVYYKVEGDDNHNAFAAQTVNVTIAKADITMTTAPAAVSDLAYSGEAQTLITAGVASFGTVLYSLDGETYNSALPTATDAGTYTVYYKVDGDDNHNAFAAQTLDVTIATNKTALNTAITDAETYYNSISESNPEIAAELLTAINTAKEVKNNADATQSEIEAATTTMNAAVTTATAKTALDNAIKDAEAYYNSIKDSNPDAAADLLTAINDAKAILANADATPTEVDAALSPVNNAVTAAQTEVALKRIIITIPAKSYVARVDADKRQIENAVAGVSLYTVASVTNSEVVLTSALSVVAAEMPYLIYNDNDEEKTISIVVSAEDADAVTYDSEHFKGTLEAKTFTDADMAAADHYVLSNGHDFVWVKDAGTLAAGKCWIELVSSSEAPARRLTIVHEGETTGISLTPALSGGEGACYDLSGRRVAKPTKGLYIVNGKKIAVK